jgi:hypothetical protein
MIHIETFACEKCFLTPQIHRVELLLVFWKIPCFVFCLNI